MAGVERQAKGETKVEDIIAPMKKLTMEKNEKRRSVKQQRLTKLPEELPSDCICYDGDQTLTIEDKMFVIIEPYDKDTKSMKDADAKRGIDKWKRKFCTDYKQIINENKDNLLYKRCKQTKILHSDIPEKVIKEFESGYFPSFQKKLSLLRELYHVCMTMIKLVMKNAEVMDEYKRDQEDEGEEDEDKRKLGHIFITAAMFERNIHYKLYELVKACAERFRKLFSNANLSIKVITITPLLVNILDQNHNTFCNKDGDTHFDVEEDEMRIVEKQDDFPEAIASAMTENDKTCYIFLQYTHLRREDPTMPLNERKKAKQKQTEDQIKEESEEKQEDEEMKND